MMMFCLFSFAKIHSSKRLTSLLILFLLVSPTLRAELGVAGTFNSFVKNNFTSQYSDIEGRLAAGGNVQLNGYGLASKISLNPLDQALVVGGDLVFDNGKIYQGSVLVGGDASGLSQSVRDGMAPGSTVSQQAVLPFDFNQEFLSLAQTSITLSTAPVTGNVDYRWGGAYLTGDCTSAIQVFRLDGQQVSTVNTFVLNCVPDDATIIINIDGLSTGMSNLGLAQLAARSSKILWNYFEAEAIDFRNIGIQGTVLAPQADLTTGPGFVDGTVIAKSWSGPMQLHNIPFDGDINPLMPSEPPVITTQPVTTGLENTPYVYDVDASDGDIGDELTYEIISAPPGIESNPVTGEISWALPDPRFVGSVSEFNTQCFVVLTGSAGVVGSDNPPTEPSVSGNPDLAIKQISLAEQSDGLKLSASINNRGIADVSEKSVIRFYAGDDSNGTLITELQVPAIASNQNLTVDTLLADPALIGDRIYAKITTSPDVEECEVGNNDRRVAVIRHKVTDKQGLSASQIYALNIEDKNAVPTVTSSPQLVYQRGQVNGARVSGNDPDVGDALSFSFKDLAAGVAIDQRTGKINIDPEVVAAGNYPLTLVLEDLRGGITEQTITLVVEENQAPQIVSKPSSRGIEGQNYVYQASAIDPNPGDTLSWGIELGPLETSIDANSGYFQWLPTADYVDNKTDQNPWCQIPPISNIGEFQPKQKWFGRNEKVLATPLVARLHDSNEDGQINDQDIPTVLAIAHSGSVDNGVGSFALYTGDRGISIWPGTPSNLQTEASAHPAIGDIDNDGFPEVVAYRYGAVVGTGGIVALNHDGTELFTTDQPVEIDDDNLNYGAITLADLDGDGTTEILARDHILNNKGEVIWVAPEQAEAQEVIALPADLDGDGDSEVIIGSRAYDHQTNTKLWDKTEELADPELEPDELTEQNTGLYTAIANFDDDEHPEVVIVNPRGRVALLDHDGEILWHVALRGNRGGGHPLIADLDGDGSPDIGVAGKDFYVVLNADGTEKWHSAIQEGSAQTGSTAFDFDGDGEAEVIYGDEVLLRVYSGRTGNVIYSFRNLSRTATEYPVVADIDNDGHAELLVVSDSGARIRAFEGDGQEWVGTRSIWNQYHYSINNVNDDASIPSKPIPSWLTHNTFRLNTFPDRNPLALPDLVIHSIAYDQASTTLSAKVKNRGLALVTQDLTVRFFSDPDNAESALLGSITTTGLTPGEEREIAISVPATQLTQTVSAEVQLPDGVVECLSDNNKTVAAVIDLRVADQAGLFATQRYALSVADTNDFPKIISAESTTITTNEPYQLQVQVADPDKGDAHEFTLRNQSEGLALSIDRRSGLIAADANTLAAGHYNFTIEVTDLSGASVEQVHFLSVNTPDNQPPEFTSSPTASGNVLEPFTYTATAINPDPAPAPEESFIRFILDQYIAGMTINPETGVITWTPDSTQIGLFPVNIIAIDEGGAQTSFRLTITINNVASNINTPPTIVSTPTGLVTAGKTFSYQVNAQDEDGDILSYGLVNGTAGMQIDAQSGLFTWLPDASLVGQSVTVGVEVSDGRGGTATQALQLPVNESVNEPPQVTNFNPPAQASAGKAYAYQLMAFDPDGEPLSFSLGDGTANGVSISEDGLIEWLPSAQQAGTTLPVIIEVIDSRGATTIIDYSVAVTASNNAPMITGSPNSPAIVGQTYQYALNAVDIDADPLSYSIATDKQAAGLSIGNEGIVSWLPTEEQIGDYSVTVTVNDGLATATRVYTLQVVPAPAANNAYPQFTGTPLRNAIVSQAYTYQIEASDPNGDALSYQVGAGAPQGLAVDSETGLITWTPTADQLGEATVELIISDGALEASLTYSIFVTEAVEPLQAYVNVSATEVKPGDTIAIKAFSTGGSGAVSLALTVNDTPLALDGAGQALFVAENIGMQVVTLQAQSGDFSSTATTNFLVLDTSDTAPPTALITAPATDEQVGGLLPILGTVNDDNLQRYELYVSLAGKGDFRLINTGTEPVNEGQLGLLDTTQLLNGQHTVLLKAYDTNNQSTTDSITVLVDDDLKVGNFSFTVEDLSIPMVGVPVRITRTYDSRRRFEDLDFGYGWTIDYQNVRVEESRVLGTAWSVNEFQYGPLGALFDFCVQPSGKPMVTVTLPDGDVERFEVAASPECNTYQLIRTVTLEFRPVGDTQSRLEALNDSTAFLLGDNLVETALFKEPVDPSRYKLTTRAGFEYFLDQAFGIEKVIDPNGNVLTYTDEGIFHSSGKSIQFIRDSEGHITTIIDPAGNRIQYNYDDRGDLVNVVERDATTTKYTYYNDHGLNEITDPLDRLVLRNIYDEAGRLIEQLDENGNPKKFDHTIADCDFVTDATNDGNTDNQCKTVVTDLDGRTTEYVYDKRGNILRETQIITDNSYDENIVTTYTYDGNDNQQTRTIGGRTWTTLHNADNDVLSSCNPLNQCVTYGGYNNRGQEGQITDERQHTYAMTYDDRGNLIGVASPGVSDPDSGQVSTPTATNIINLKGLVGATTDLRGLTTTFTYYNDGDARDQKRTESNPVTGTVTYTYDANNNVASETRQRTVGDSIVNETVSYDYDSRDRLIRTTYPDGSYTETTYDDVGNMNTERDRFGNVTKMDHDVYNRLVLTTYPDGSTEARTYTPEGLLKTVTDRNQRITEHEYDDAGRLRYVRNQSDNTATQTRYNDVGWVIAEYDENQNLTQYQYDNAGRRVRVIRHIDGGTQEHSFSYYPNGELQSETDANAHTTSYTLNELDQRIKVEYHNKTTMQERFDFMGTRLKMIDQENRSTAFGNDMIGRLTSVTPEVSINGEAVPPTTYTYDEVGNRLTQTDANGHTTTWTYDYYGRVLTRTLPEGQTESMMYTTQECAVQSKNIPAGASASLCEVTTHTDFNGDTITTVVDNMGRVDTMTYSKDGRIETYTYYPNGQTETVTVQVGGTTEVTEYFYDNRNRLEREERPSGETMEYAYDDANNRTLVKVTRGGSVTTQTSFTYDELNRLETVTNDLNPSDVTTYTYDAVGNMDTVTYANGMVTDYDYNSINQLTDVYTRDSNGTLVSHFNYGLTATGRREVIIELDGRSTANCYDNLYRLTHEVIFDSPAAPITEGCLTDTTGVDYTANYEYDWTGNRENQTINGTVTNYTYDMNDRLESVGSIIYSYDDNGNTLSENDAGVLTTYIYDGRNKLSSVDKNGTSTSYTYNHNGIRNSKTESGVTTLFIVDENRAYAQVLEEVVNGDSEVGYVYGLDLLNQTRNNETYTFHYDGLGSVRMLSDSSGVITDEYSYFSFGELDENSSSGTTENNYLFAGEQYDESLGQYYLRARYYDQGIGRFLVHDPYMGSTSDPQSLHRYTYAHLDPVSNADPSGNITMMQISAGLNSASSLATSAIRIGQAIHKFETLVDFIFTAKEISSMMSSGVFSTGIKEGLKQSASQLNSIDVDAAVESLVRTGPTVMSWSLGEWFSYISPRANQLDRFVIYLPQAPMTTEIPFTSVGRGKDKIKVNFRVDPKGKDRVTGVGIGFKSKKGKDNVQQIWRMDHHKIHAGKDEGKDAKFIVDGQFHYHVRKAPRR